MIKIAIVDDEEVCRKTLSDHIIRFFDGRDEKYNIVQYSDAIDFLTNYKFSFDIVFLDIDMRLSNGMDMAYKLRELDQNIVIIFQTHLAQYAIKGYEVGAIGYLLKPVDYYSVSMRLKSALKVVAMNEIDVNIRVTTNDGIRMLYASEVKYIEVVDHKLFFHAASGDYADWGQLGTWEEKLRGCGFFRCHRCFLINLNYVTGIDTVLGKNVLIGETAIPLSRKKKTELMDVLAAYRN